jgi:IS5 family transposase
VKKLPEGEIKGLTQYAERLKASIRARVEHPFHIVKNLLGHRKTRYRGIAKNEIQWEVLFVLAKIYLTRQKVMA